MKWWISGACAALMFLPLPGRAQDAAPTPENGGVRLQFVPPPMKGTISLGVYDAKGRLVRALKSEATPKDFIVALNGLITFWDGKDDHGGPVPSGEYSAHGFMVGDVGVEGESFEGNDWIGSGDDARRIKHISEIFALPDGGLGIGAEGTEGNFLVSYDAKGKPSKSNGGLPEKAVVRQDKIFRVSKKTETEIPIDGLTHPVAACPSRAGGVWVIDALGDRTEVKEFSATGVFQRRLTVKAGEATPRQIAASATADQIYLLEEGPQVQQVRSLVLVSTEPGSGPDNATSTWKVVFEKAIWPSGTLEAVRDRLKMPDGKSFSPQEKISVVLRPNPLEQGKPGRADIGIGLDSEGSYLRLADGLPLVHITDTASLKWAAIGRTPDGKELIVFQSDGAVIEQYRVTQIVNMMGFDCGSFQYTSTPEE